jgi:site-specific DNA-methyltransferase (adenine-specific)
MGAGDGRMKTNKIYQGDCLELMRKLSDNSVDLIMTSPPYAEQRKNIYGGIPEEKYPCWFKEIGIEIKRVLKPTGSFILNIKEHSNKEGRSLYVFKTVITLVEKCGLHLIDTFAWTKNSFPGKIKNKFKNAWEPCYHFGKSVDINIYPDSVATDIKPESTARAYRKFTGKTKNGSGFQCTASDKMRNAKKAYPSNHLQINNILNQWSDNKWHPAVYPIELCDFFIKSLTTEGDLIIDIFSGSGTTCISALKLNRNYMGFEKSKEYSELSKKRIQEHSQQKLPEVFMEDKE